MECPSCHSEVASGLIVCPRCGAPMRAAAGGAAGQSGATAGQGGAAEGASVELADGTAAVQGSLKDQIAAARKTSHNKRQFIKGGFFLLVLLLMLLVATVSGADEWLYKNIVQPAVSAITTIFGGNADDGAKTSAIAQSRFDGGGIADAVGTAEASNTENAPQDLVVTASSTAAGQSTNTQDAALAFAQATYAPKLSDVRNIINSSIFSSGSASGGQSSGGTGSSDSSSGSDTSNDLPNLDNDKSLANFLAVARGECTYMAGIGSWNFTTGRIVYSYVDLGADGQLDLVVAHESEDEEWSIEARDFIKVTRYNPLLAYSAKSDGTLCSVLQGLGSGNSAWTITKDGCFAVSGISGGLYEVHAYTVKDGEPVHVVSYRYNYWNGKIWRDYTYDPADQSTWADVENTREYIDEEQYAELQAKYGKAARMNESFEWLPMFDEDASETEGVEAASLDAPGEQPAAEGTVADVDAGADAGTADVDAAEDADAVEDASNETAGNSTELAGEPAQPQEDSAASAEESQPQETAVVDGAEGIGAEVAA